jgi:endonuclease/exonuclease/phosphatase family metal-dependent hydrolase
MPLRLVSYKAVGSDMRRAPHRILDLIARLEADIVVLQEADKRLGARPTALPHALIERETDFEVVPLAETDVSLGWHGNAILARKGISVKATERLHLPGLEPRGAVLADLVTPQGPLLVVGAHLGLLRGWRRRQLRAILDHLDDLRPGGGATSVIAGDFNEWSWTKGLETLGDSHRVVIPGRSFPAGRPVAPLDRIAHGAGIEVLGSGVDTSPAARHGSDHLPVWADLRISDDGKTQE